MLSGSPGDYDVAAQTAIKTVLANAAEVSTSAVSLTLTAGSVIVTADIFFGTQEGANFAASRMSASVFLDGQALETALNAKFAAEGLGVTTSVQRLLAFPQAVVVAPSPPPLPPPLPPAPTSGVWWYGRHRRRCRRVCGHPHPRPRLPSEAQEASCDSAITAQELGPVVNAQVVSGTAADVPMGVPVHAAASSSSSKPTLAEMVELLKQHCGVDGDNFSDVVHKAAHQLGIDRAGKSLMEVAMMCAAARLHTHTSCTSVYVYTCLFCICIFSTDRRRSPPPRVAMGTLAVTDWSEKGVTATPNAIRPSALRRRCARRQRRLTPRAQFHPKRTASAMGGAAGMGACQSVRPQALRVTPTCRV